MGKKKRQGHYCRICGQYKANEKFSGKRHAAHICKECRALPITGRNELRNISEIERISGNFFISKEDRKRLERLAGDRRYPESAQYARDALNDFRSRMDEYHGNAQDDGISEQAAPVTYSELPDQLREEVRSELEELIRWFIGETGHIPEEDDIEGIVQMFCEEFSEAASCSEEHDLELIPDDGIMSVFSEILKKAIERNAPRNDSDFCSLEIKTED